MAIVLTDDGTLDTVLLCTNCGEEFRANYDAQPGNESYDKFVEGFIREIESEHDC